MGGNASTLGRLTSRSGSSNNVIANSANNLPPITFHPTHGENVRLLHDGAVARRAESFCKGIAFSNRPLKVNEKIFLKFAETSTSWSGVLRFGFTSVDPAHLRHGGLPKYACPDFTNRPGYWAKALAERYAERDTVLFFYVTAGGDVHFGVNGEEKGVFFSGVDTRQPLWALLDIYGNTIAVEVLDSVTQVNNLWQQQQRSVSLPSGVDNLAQTIEALSVNANENRRHQVADHHLHHQHHQHQQHHVVHPPPSAAHFGGGAVAPPPEPLAFFQAVHGHNIRLSNDCRIATRSDTEFSRGYAFVERPVLPHEQIVIQIIQTESVYVGSLAFGLTTCNPATLTAADLPDDADYLLDRPEYWVVHKDVASSPQRGDELGFCITSDGEVLLYKNRTQPVVIMHVDQTQRLWAFFDVFGNTIKIKLQGSISAALFPHSTTTDAGSNNERGTNNVQLRVILPPSSASSGAATVGRTTKGALSARLPERRSLSEDGDRSHPLTDLPSPGSVAGLDGAADNASNECAVCYENAVDCVLYTCGHMCMCYECAYQLWHRVGGGQCPICRADIRDVIRTYRS